MSKKPFWEEKKLEQMSDEEWESLCDGCGRCCLVKLEDEESNQLLYTNVVCRYFMNHNCRCRHYPMRHELVSECVSFNAKDIKRFWWLPKTCAYRTLAENRPLPQWHPLVSGTPDSVHRADISIKDKCISEQYVHIEQLEDHVIDWIDYDGDKPST